jgi:fumarate reductase subunit D
MIRRSAEPLLWMMFSTGGVIAALTLPIVLLLFGVAFPLGWLTPPPLERLAPLIGNPLTRLALLVVSVASLFHAAHRFRYTLYDGLQIKHLNEMIAVLCYGGAILGSLAATYILVTWR